MDAAVFFTFFFLGPTRHAIMVGLCPQPRRALCPSARSRSTDYFNKTGVSCFAAGQLVARFSPAVRQAVKRRLDLRLRSKVDCEDILQEVWLVFFSGALGRELFDGPDRLQAFLIGVARKKILEANHRWLD